MSDARELYGPPGRRWMRYGRPNVLVTLFRDGEPIARTYALPDTGAMYSLFPRWMMEPLGVSEDDLDPEGETARNSVTAGTYTLVTTRRTIEAEIKGRRVQLVGTFSPHTEDLILGTEDCLQHFRMVMELRSGNVELEPSDFPERPIVPPPPPGMVMDLPRVTASLELPEGLRGEHSSGP